MTRPARCGKFSYGLALARRRSGGTRSRQAMKELIEELERWGADVIFGRAKGLRAALMRFAMRALSGVFRMIVQIRLWRYRSGWRGQH